MQNFESKILLCGNFSQQSPHKLKIHHHTISMFDSSKKVFLFETQQYSIVFDLFFLETNVREVACDFKEGIIVVVNFSILFERKNLFLPLCLKHFVFKKRTCFFPRLFLNIGCWKNSKPLCLILYLQSNDLIFALIWSTFIF